MRITYLPLYRLTQKVVADVDTKDYIQLLDRSINNTKEQNEQLKIKLENYRVFMQKSLLDSLFSDQNRNDEITQQNIDQLFDTEKDNELFVVQVGSGCGIFPWEEVRDYFREMLPGEEPCLVLEVRSDASVYLINYTGSELNKDEVLVDLLKQLYESRGFMSAVSSSTGSPLDIPSLYEMVSYGSRHWPDSPVVDCKIFPSASAELTYPHDELHQFSELLYKHQFSDAGNMAENLFSIIEHSIQSKNQMPDFFVRCVFIDILSVITNCMNKYNVDFDKYRDLYYETLYFCRSHSYEEKAEDIVENIRRLLGLYEKEISKSVDPALIRAIMEESYSDPNLSIAMMADRFHVSIACMSYWVRKEVGQNFSDYLWELRLEKAKELLCATSMSVDEVAESVGYLNAASFRRKFKQATGITPSKFREGKD